MKKPSKEPVNPEKLFTFNVQNWLFTEEKFREFIRGTKSKLTKRVVPRLATPEFICFNYNFNFSTKEKNPLFPFRGGYMLNLDKPSREEQIRDFKQEYSEYFQNVLETYNLNPLNIVLEIIAYRDTITHDIDIRDISQ